MTLIALYDAGVSIQESPLSREPLTQWPTSLNFPLQGLPKDRRELSCQQRHHVARANHFVAHFERAHAPHPLASVLQRQILASDNISEPGHIVDTLTRPYAALSCAALAQWGFYEELEGLRIGTPLFRPVRNGGILIDGTVFREALDTLTDGVGLDLSRRAPHDASAFLYGKNVVSTITEIERPAASEHIGSVVLMESWPNIFPPESEYCNYDVKCYNNTYELAKVLPGSP